TIQSRCFPTLRSSDLLPVGVNLEELDANRLATGILGQRVSQDLLGLGIAAVSHIDVGFRDRVDLLGADPIAEADVYMAYGRHARSEEHTSELQSGGHL